MMKKLDYQNVRGTIDYLPEQEMIRRQIRRTLEATFEQYGCLPLETPILNYTELMASKYAGGAEILQEMYTLTDRGARNLALRYDLTIPFAKVIALNPTIPLPFKRYEIGKVFRDGPIKAGRFREFTQCDVDIVGVKSTAAEAELMQMAVDAFQKLQVEIVIQYNNRKLLYGLLQLFNVQEEWMNRVILILDKMEKIERAALIAELQQLGLMSDSLVAIEQFLNDKPTSITYFEQFTAENDNIKEGMEELKELQQFLQALQIEESCVFSPFLARGLEIYTGTIYEIFLNNGAIKSSIGSGGRYDNAIGGLLQSDAEFATVGISFGLDVIYTAFELANMKPSSSAIDVYIIPLATEKEALKLAQALRRDELRVEVELSGKKLRRAMDRANRANVGQVIVLGEQEVMNNRYEIKNMQSGEVERRSFTFSEK